MDSRFFLLQESNPRTTMLGCQVHLYCVASTRPPWPRRLLVGKGCRIYKYIQKYTKRQSKEARGYLINVQLLRATMHPLTSLTPFTTRPRSVQPWPSLVYLTPQIGSPPHAAPPSQSALVMKIIIHDLLRIAFGGVETSSLFNLQHAIIGAVIGDTPT